MLYGCFSVFVTLICGANNEGGALLIDLCKWRFHVNSNKIEGIGFVCPPLTDE